MEFNWIDSRILVVAAMVYFATEYFKTLIWKLRPTIRSIWIMVLAFILGAILGYGGLRVPGLGLFPDFPGSVGGIVLGLFAAVMAIGGHYARMNGIQARVEAERKAEGKAEPSPPVPAKPSSVPAPIPPATPTPLPIGPPDEHEQEEPAATDADLARWAAPQALFSPSGNGRDRVLGRHDTPETEDR